MAEIVLATLIVLLGIGGLGAMVVLEVSRLGVLKARRLRAQKRAEMIATELEQTRRRMADIEARIQHGQTRLTTLAAERERLVALARTVQADKVELVHEIGAPVATATLFRSTLRTTPDFARIDPRQVIGAPVLWQRKNVAHVWAETPEAAHAILHRTFGARSGVLPTGIERIGTERIGLGAGAAAPIAA